MDNMWKIKQANQENTLDLYIYNEVEGDEYNWFGELVRSETSANYFRKELEAHPEVTQINVYINSNGGSVFEGTAIYNQLKRHPAHKTVYIDGFACSVASVIAMSGDEIIMPKNALMMIHNMWMGAIGNAAELRKAADDLDVINAAGRQAYLEKANGKIDELELTEMMNAETWLTAEQCIQYGLADKFADYDADMKNAENILQKANISIEQRIKIQKELTAQLRQITESYAGVNNSKKTNKSNEPNSIMQMLGGFFNA